MANGTNGNGTASAECKDHPTAIPRLVMTPDLTHYAKYECPVCGRFLAWVKPPQGAHKARRQTFLIGGVQFNTKAALTDYVKETLSGADHHSHLAGERFSVIRELLDYHPESEQKIGCGVDRIDVRPNGEFGSSARGFWIVRTDGSETDFSYRKCLEGDKAFRNKFIRACRFAVKEHIEAFRAEFFRVAIRPSCPLTGRAITWAESHVDHIPPCTFERIVQSFAILYTLDLDDPSLCITGADGLLIPMFASEVLRDRFVHFHNCHAHLRVISTEANTSLVPQTAGGAM